jgi:CubicO group peptidase (beta-lactamase class C family)
MKNIILSIGIVLFSANLFAQATTNNAALSAQPSFIKDSLDTYIEREMKRWQVPGLAIAVVKDGKVVVSKGYGVKEYGKSAKVNEFTLFQIASNSKAFTGTAVALLNQQKRLLLDERVTKYMPSFKLYDETSTQLCTVRDLLCHRIGLQTFQGDFLNWGSNLSRKEIIEHMQFTKPVHAFRYKYGYCNAAFITAGELVKAVSDTSWDDYIKCHFFVPLQMKHTNSSYNDLMTDENACIPHTLVQGKIVKMPFTNIDNMGPSASINSCVRDMSNWLLFQLDSGRFDGKRIVPFSVLEETRKSNMVVRDVNSRLFKTKHFSTYGLGWFSYDYEGRRVWEHGGGANGFVTKTEFIPEENLGVLVYTNTDANSLYEALVKQILDAYLKVPYKNISEIYFEGSNTANKNEWKEIDSLRTLAALKNKPIVELSKIVGTYNNSFYGNIEIKLEKGKLSLHFSHHPNNIGKLEYLSDNKFLCTYSDVTCGVQTLPIKIENNEVVGITIKVNDFIDYLPYEFVKVKN